MSGAFQGWLLIKVNWVERLLLLFAGLALVFRVEHGHGAGFIALGIVVLWQWIRMRQVSRL
jgi:TRAP-type uncharacterized transport system fused permease subunit